MILVYDNSMTTGCKPKQVPQLNTDRPHLRDYLHTSPDYRHTDDYFGVVMILLCSEFEGNCILLHSASRAPNVNRYAPDI